MQRKQLHVRAREGFRVYSHLAAHEAPESRNAGYIPILSWPNGRTCVEGNMFLGRLLEKGCSLKSQGGTLSTYATYLSHLLRYSFHSNRHPSDLTDADVRFAFVQLSSIDPRTGERRNNRTSSIKVAAVWFEFLEFVGVFYGLKNFLSSTKENFNAGIGKIKAYKTSYTVRHADGKFRMGERWYHPIFPPERDAEEPGMPLNDSDFAKLREVADDGDSANFIRQRRLVMLELFEILGFRRLEAVLLRASDVEKTIRDDDLAKASGDDSFTPSVTFRSVKKKGNRIYVRSVPISRVSLAFLQSYNNLRKRHLKMLGVKETSDSAFLVSHTKGKRLRANTLTQEFRTLATKAGIIGRCSPHMMRHRFITQAFVRLIRAHELSSPDEFQRMLLDSTRFKRKVMEYAGHVSEETLSRYIHLAFDEVASFSKILDRTELEGALDAVHRQKDRVRAAMARGESAKELYTDLLLAIEQVEALRLRLTA